MHILKVVRSPLDEFGEPIPEAKDSYFLVEHMSPKIHIECESYEKALAICEQLGRLMGLKLDFPSPKLNISSS